MTTSTPDSAEIDATRQGFSHLGRRLLIPALLGVLACVGLALFADGEKVAARLKEFPLPLLLPILGLSLANYALRFVRWQAYLHRLDIDLPWTKSLGIFLVGFLLSVTPGKAGELGKAWLVRELGGGKALRAIPAVLAERATDLLGVILLLGLGALPFAGGVWIALGATLVVAAAVAVLTWERGASLLFKLLAKMPILGKRSAALREIYDLLRGLLSPRLLALGLVIAVVAWGAEGIGFYYALRPYDANANVLSAVFDYSASTCLGSLSMLPGGLLAAEGTLAALSSRHGLDAAAAASATIVIRAATLWFAVVLGLLALPFVLRGLRRQKIGTTIPPPTP